MSASEFVDGLHFFESKQDFSIAWKRLPHWAQVGTVCFITWRTADSLPKLAIERLYRRRQELLRQSEVDPTGDWGETLARLPSPERAKLRNGFLLAWDQELDKAAGACVLRKPVAAEIVMNSLRHFDNQRYLLTDAVVMPNHVHLLVAFRDEASLLTQCTSWKRFTATRINQWMRETGEGQPLESGKFWQVEQFDHLVRNPDYFDFYRRYIAENPRKAGLSSNEYRWYSKQFAEGDDSHQSRSD